MGLGIVDGGGAGSAARKVGEGAETGLAQVGGGPALFVGFGRLGAPLGELELTERVAIVMALDAEAEAEEITAIMDGELTHVEGFAEFRERLLVGGM